MHSNARNPITQYTGTPWKSIEVKCTHKIESASSGCAPGMRQLMQDALNIFHVFRGSAFIAITHNCFTHASGTTQHWKPNISRRSNGVGRKLLKKLFVFSSVAFRANPNTKCCRVVQIEVEDQHYDNDLTSEQRTTKSYSCKVTSTLQPSYEHPSFGECRQIEKSTD
jgi:hypothetical protein